MPRMRRRLLVVATRLMFLASAGALFQTTGCSITPQSVASTFTTTFVNSLLTNIFNYQLGVYNSYVY